MSQLTFGRESIRRILDDGYAAGLIEAHDAEVRHSLKYRIAPNQGVYWQLEDTGQLVSFGARSGTELVGYATFLVQAIYQSTPELHAISDGIYLHPKYRHSGNGLVFIKFCDAEMESEGVVSIQWGVPARRGFHRIFFGLGYENTQYVYGRRIE